MYSVTAAVYKAEEQGEAVTAAVYEAEEQGEAVTAAEYRAEEQGEAVTVYEAELEEEAAIILEQVVDEDCTTNSEELSSQALVVDNTSVPEKVIRLSRKSEPVQANSNKRSRLSKKRRAGSSIM